MRIPRTLFACSVAGFLGILSAHAAEPFYAGKTVTFVVGNEAGSSPDISCRLIAQFIVGHIAGNPTIIIRNMPSSGSVVGANYVGQQAKRDGLTLNCGAVAPSYQLSHQSALQVDLTQFEVIAGNGETPMIYARADIPPGIKTGQDIFKVKPSDLIVAGLAVDAMKDIELRSFLDGIGMNGYRYVTGFGGDPAGRAAIQQKFINIFSEAMTSWDQITSHTLFKTGEVVPIVQGGVPDANGKRVRDQRAPDVPTSEEFYIAHFGKPPSGPAWDLINVILGNVNISLQWLALPPGSPPEALAAMRAAIDPLNQDPAFVAASDKIRGKGNLERSGTEVQAVIKSYLNMPPPVFEYYDAMVKSGAVLAQKKQ